MNCSRYSKQLRPASLQHAGVAPRALADLRGVHHKRISAPKGQQLGSPGQRPGFRRYRPEALKGRNALKAPQSLNPRRAAHRTKPHAEPETPASPPGRQCVDDALPGAGCSVSPLPSATRSPRTRRSPPAKQRRPRLCASSISKSSSSLLRRPLQWPACAIGQRGRERGRGCRLFVSMGYRACPGCLQCTRAVSASDRAGSRFFVLEMR